MMLSDGVSLFIGSLPHAKYEDYSEGWCIFLRVLLLNAIS